MPLPAAFDEALEAGLRELRVGVDARGMDLLHRYVERLLFWNRKVNLTSVVEPAEVAEVHLVDCLALLRSMDQGRTVLDVGCGPGLPGVVLACACPTLHVTCCDSVGKKIAFVKSVCADLGVPVDARTVRATGRPFDDGLPAAQVVMSRAVADPVRWLPLGRGYLTEGGRLLAMLGGGTDDAELVRLGRQHGLRLAGSDRFRLPRSGALRCVATFVEAGERLLLEPR